MYQNQGRGGEKNCKGEGVAAESEGNEESLRTPPYAATLRSRGRHWLQFFVGKSPDLESRVNFIFDLNNTIWTFI